MTTAPVVQRAPLAYNRAAMSDLVLETRGITKRFVGVVALSDVSFGLRRGEVHALCGENGAGKSTLIQVLGGVLPAGSYRGSLLVDGKPVAFQSIRHAEQAGIAVIHQELALVDEMTVADNVFLGSEPSRFGLVRRDRMREATRRVLRQLRLDVDPERKVGELGMGQKQLVEIARALVKQARILVLDEPTSALSDREAQRLLEIVLELGKSKVSCIYVSHKLDEVFRVSNRITVLRDGETACTLITGETDESHVVEQMVGRSVEELFAKRSRPAREVLLEVEDLSVAPRRGEPARLAGIGFEVRGGRVLGVGGLMGAGRTELLMHLFGCWGARLAGRVRFLGEPLPEADPRGNVRRGLALVTEDRKRWGLSLEASVGFNLSLSSLARFSSAGFVHSEREKQSNREMVDSLSIKAASLDVSVGTLSGGNQQKVVLGRALMTGPRVVLLDEPTRGIDIGAKSEIYSLIRRLAGEGLGVVLVSSDLPELLGLADSIVMLVEGRMGGVFDDTAVVTQADLLDAAMASGGATSRRTRAL